MKRHESLHPLSQHHHFALVQALEIRRAQALPAAGRAAALRRAARKFLRFWRQTGRKHFREEEEVLLPAYARHVPLDEDPDTMKMLADHAFLRALIGDLEAALKARDPVENLLSALSQRLHDHVRLEENVVFPRIEAQLGEAEMRALGRRLTRLHPQRACRVA